MGVEQPEGYLAPQQMQVPASAIQRSCEQLGVPPEVFAQFLEQLQASRRSRRSRGLRAR